MCQLDAAMRHNPQPERSSCTKDIQWGTCVIHNCVYYLSGGVLFVKTDCIGYGDQKGFTLQVYNIPM